MKKVLVCILTLIMLFCFTGCDLLHTCNYSKATCESAAMCSCGKTQGEAIGHTTKLGLCNRCGDYNNEYESVIQRIQTNLINSVSEFNSAGKTIIYNSQWMSASVISECQNDISEAMRYLDSAINSCDSISELTTLKGYLVDMKNALNNINSSNTISGYIDNYSKYGKIYQQKGEQASDLLTEWLSNDILNELQ